MIKLQKHAPNGNVKTLVNVDNNEISAMDSKGTVYFTDDFNDAKEITQQTLDAFDKLCASVSVEQRQSLLDANRPKMAQLKEEFKNLEEELIHDDH